MAKVRAEVRIEGLVQGVYFRAGAAETAERLGLTGWVMNTPDGAVEAVFEGDEEDVKEAVRWCRKGPPMARVRDVTVRWGKYSGEFGDFSIRYG